MQPPRQLCAVLWTWEVVNVWADKPQRKRKIRICELGNPAIGPESGSRRTVQSEALGIELNLKNELNGPPEQFRGSHLYFRPTNLEQATQILAAHSAQILAGGTDFFPALGDRRVQVPLLDLSRISTLKGIDTEAGWIRIGGLTTWSEIIAAPMPRCFEALKAAAREIGGVQIQNRGTIAGNLSNASPAADGVPPLLALNAEIELVSATSVRRIPLASFILGNRRTVRQPEEILAAVLVPRDAENAASSFAKLGARRYLVISIVMVAAVVNTDSQRRISDARIAVGSCSARAQRLPELEQDLIGRRAHPGFASAVLPRHIAPLSPISDVRATAEYRRDAAVTLIGRALDGCVGGR
jgi:CO/xanthine dehydrogenase FAD-binding subunit